MADEKQEASDKHFEAMKYLQNMRDDIVGILTDTLNHHYDYLPDSLADEQAERDKLREDLREVQARIDVTIDGL